MQKIVECVPNFSEGRDPAKVEQILAPLRAKAGVKLLDYQTDADHHRMVVTLVGEPEPLVEAVLAAMDAAVRLIDLTRHCGQHPRMGAVDVVPFVPIRNITMDEAVALSRKLGAAAAQRFDLPIFLYEKAASAPHRVNLADIRKGQFEAMPEKLKDPAWRPDFGPTEVHPTAGVTAVGARMPLVAFNVNLDTADLAVADRIAKAVRHISGGLRYVKAMGVELKDRGIVQVSINMTDYQKTPLYRVFELIRIEARRHGVNVVGSEIVGLTPMEALIDSAVYYLGLEQFSMQQVLEARILEE